MKKISLKLVVVTVLFMGFGVATSNAQSKGERPQKPPTFSELLEKMDSDEDGKLAKSEVEGPLKDSFDTVDADEDGFISEEELKKAPKPKGRGKKE